MWRYKVVFCVLLRKQRERSLGKLWYNWVCSHWFSCLSSLAGKWMCFAARGLRVCGVVSAESFWASSHFSTQDTVPLLPTARHAAWTTASPDTTQCFCFIFSACWLHSPAYMKLKTQVELIKGPSLYLMPIEYKQQIDLASCKQYLSMFTCWSEMILPNKRTVCMWYSVCRGRSQRWCCSLAFHRKSNTDLFSFYSQ